jgi:hypothetical protein
MLTSQATCPAGTVLVGGGSRVTADGDGTIGRVMTLSTYPSAPNQWTAIGVTRATIEPLATSGRQFHTQAYAMCAVIAGP